MRFFPVGSTENCPYLARPTHLLQYPPTLTCLTFTFTKLSNVLYVASVSDMITCINTRAPAQRYFRAPALLHVIEVAEREHIPWDRPPSGHPYMAG